MTGAFHWLVDWAHRAKKVIFVLPLLFLSSRPSTELVLFVCTYTLRL
jgi:hypothetical protein